MAEYSRLARGSFVTAASPVAQYVNLPFQPTRVTLKNITAYSAPSQYAVTNAFWDVAMAQGVAAIEYISASTAPWVEAVDYVFSQGITTFAAGQMLQLGPKIQIASATAANPIVVTTSVAHNLSTGNVVFLEGLYQTATLGMPQLSNIPWVITVLSSTTFSIAFNGAQSNYTALTGIPAGAYVQQILYPNLYLPQDNFITALTLSGTNVVVSTASNHNYVLGQQIAFRIPSSFGSTQLNSLPNVGVPGSPTYYYVTAIQSNTQFTCSALSAGVTAFNSNQTVASVPGLTWAQVLAVGDVNTGGWPYTGGNLYPSPSFPTYSGGMPTVNGPAIQGAFVNNTAQGFIVGLGTGNVQTSAALLTPSSIYVWTAEYFDIG